MMAAGDDDLIERNAHVPGLKQIGADRFPQALKTHGIAVIERRFFFELIHRFF